MRAGTLIFLALAAYGGHASADIYRLVDARGMTHYTNIPPQGRDRLYVVKVLESDAQVPGEAVRSYPGNRRLRYRSHIEEAAQANNLDPALIHAVIAVESGYDSSARSPKGAVGLMQLMPETAQRYSVTDRLDPAQNIRGGARYLRDLLLMFDNDLRLALAAYNAGEQAVLKHGNRVPPYRETVAYVPRVMAHYRRNRTGS